MQKGGMKYIRDTYGVPAKRGGVVSHPKYGTGCIRSADNARLWVFFSDNKARYMHPTDNLRYFDVNDDVERTGAQ